MISAILLAAGESIRCGENKLLAPLRGRPMMVHTLEALQACDFAEVIVVVGYEEARVRSILLGRQCRTISNPDFEQGMSGSIRAGLRAVSPSSGAVLVCPADMPLLRPRDVCALQAAYDADPNRIVAPSAAGRQANPVILPRRFWPEIEALRGDVGCKEILRRHPENVVHVTLPSVGVLQDADTPEAVENLRRRLERPLSEITVVIRGAGEMASAVAHRLARCRLRVCMTEIPRPLAIRRRVCFSEAVFDGTATVEGVTARLAHAADRFEECWKRGDIPLLIDPDGEIIDRLQPDVVVDGVMAKRNLGTRLSHAPLVIGLGPGFEAGVDVHVVIETNRGHSLGTIIASGSAEPDTGKPGNILGYESERVFKAPHAGAFTAVKQIGDPIEQGETIGFVDSTPVRSQLKGILRGIMRGGTSVAEGTKLADLDPRSRPDYCTTISDKARTISGAVLEAILMYYNL